MTERPGFDLQKAEIRTMEVASGGSAVKYRLAVFGSADDECNLAAAGAAAIGVFLDDGSPGDKVRVILLGGNGRILVLVGTGGATRGVRAKGVADGVTDATLVAGGTTLTHIPGFFMESGVAGDVVGFRPALMVGTEA